MCCASTLLEQRREHRGDIVSTALPACHQGPALPREHVDHRQYKDGLDILEACV
jgi:hypothetical protein